MRIYTRGKKGIYWVDVELEKERVRRSTGTADRAQAQEYAARLASDLWRVKRLGEKPQVTWDTAVVAWVNDHRHLKSIHEVASNLKWLSQHLRGELLANIDGARIRGLVKARKAQVLNTAAIEVATRNGQRPPEPKLTSNATVNRHLAALSCVLVYAHHHEWLAAVPPIIKLQRPRAA